MKQAAAAAQAERRAAPKPAARAHEVPTGHCMSAFAPSGDRLTYPSDEGLS
jgi:hypothetical protein